MTPEVRQALTDYLFETGKRKISKAGPSMSDQFAEHFVTELQNLGAEDRAEELYKYYKQYWLGVDDAENGLTTES